MKISIIVPIYNSSIYLKRCIDSILNQTFKDFELLLVDDGSTDGSASICDEYAKVDYRVHTFHQENLGQAVARNKAIDMATGDYIGFVDSDDYIHPKMFEMLFNNAENNNAVISICSHEAVSGNDYFCNIDNVTVQTWQGKQYLKYALCNGIPIKPWVLWNKLIRRDYFGMMRMPEGRIFEDASIVYKLIYEAEKIVDCSAKLYYFVDNPSSTIRSGFTKKQLDWLLVVREMRTYFEKKQDLVLTKHVNRMYLDALVEMIPKVKKYLNDTEINRKLMRDLRLQVKIERKCYPINIQTHPALYEIIYPCYSYLYWTVQGVKNKLERGKK